MRKKSKRIPRRLINTLNYVMNGMRPIEEVGPSEVLVLKLQYRTALEALIKGEASVQDIDTLIYGSNMVIAIWHQGLGTEYKHIANAGADAIKSLRDRSRNTGRNICTGPELTAIKEMMELLDEQLSIIKVRDFQNAAVLMKAAELAYGV